MSSSFHQTVGLPDVLDAAGAVHSEPPPVEAPSGSSLAFALFIVLNGVLFMRPSEILEFLNWVPLYEIVILLCLLLSFPATVRRFNRSALARQPIHLCVLAMLPAIALSHLSRFAFSQAYEGTYEFAKVLVYYVLFVSLVTTFSRLRCFLMWMAAFIMVLAVVALLQYNGIVDIPSLKTLEQVVGIDENGDVHVIRRMVSTGIYNDPNDLCLILVFGMGICLYFMGDLSLGMARFLWAGVLGGFGYALTLTQSRGGFIALLIGMLVFLWARFGWRKAVPLALAALPIMLVLFGGRQTAIDLSDRSDTAQGRMQIWKDGLELLKEAPFFGIGQGEYVEQVGYVAHNSFVHSFTELGCLGGTLFTGAFFLAMWSLYKVGAAGPGVLEAELQRLQPYLLAAIVGYLVGICSLSRPYVVPTYMMLGTVATYIGLPDVLNNVALPQMTPRLLGVLTGVGIGTLASLYLILRVIAA